MNELPKIDKLSCEESEVEIKNEILNIIKNEGKRSQIGSFILTNEAISRLEEELYNEYPKYKDYNTYLTCKGNILKRFKTIGENNIKKNDVILVNIIE